MFVGGASGTTFILTHFYILTGLTEITHFTDRSTAVKLRDWNKPHTNKLKVKLKALFRTGALQPRDTSRLQRQCCCEWSRLVLVRLVEEDPVAVSRFMKAGSEVDRFCSSLKPIVLGVFKGLLSYITLWMWLLKTFQTFSNKSFPDASLVKPLSDSGM